MRAMNLAIAAALVSAALVRRRPSARSARARTTASARRSTAPIFRSRTDGRTRAARTIFGALVPYGRVWCPGADEATTLSTSKPLRIGSLLLDAPQYTLWILPTANEWQLVVNKQTGAVAHAVPPGERPGPGRARKARDRHPVEQLTFALRENPAGGGTIVFTWEKTEASVPFTVETR